MGRALLVTASCGLHLRCLQRVMTWKLAAWALCLPWEMFMDLQTGKVCGSVHSSAGTCWLFCSALLGKPTQECASFTLGRKQQECIPQHAAIWEPQEKYVGLRRESACSPGGKENVMCNYWAVTGSEAQLTPSPADLRDSSGSAYYEKAAASLSSPSLSAALSQDNATVTYWWPQRQHSMCHYGSGCKVTQALVWELLCPKMRTPTL